MPGIWVTQWHDVCLGIHDSSNLDIYSSNCFSFGLALLAVCSFPGRHFMLLASITSWYLHCSFGFTHIPPHIALSRAPCRDSDHATNTWPLSHSFQILLKVSQLLQSSCLYNKQHLHDTKVCHWFLSSSWAHWDHGCCCPWVPGQLNTVKWIRRK
jgi:hypothetical protein